MNRLQGNQLIRTCLATGVLAATAILWGTALAQPNAEPLSDCRSGMRSYESERGRQLLGELVPEDFPRLLPGWDAEFTAYEPAADFLESLAAVDRKIEIICVLGTWCGDSRREVPRFWKILQEADNPNLELTMFGVGRTDDQAADRILNEMGFDENLREVYGVQLVPTFIFLSDGEEMGRIIETPTTILEQDAALIVAPGPGQVRNVGWR